MPELYHVYIYDKILIIQKGQDAAPRVTFDMARPIHVRSQVW